MMKKKSGNMPFPPSCLPPPEEILSKFKAKPTDIIIVTAPKCGTTWLQMIFHQLRSHGDTSFHQINVAVPFIEAIDLFGLDLSKDQPFQPNVYKTHATYEILPKGAAKYIFMIRNPADAIYSLYNFVKGSATTFGITLEEFVKYMAIDENERFFGNIYKILRSWLPHRKDPNLLWLHYEDFRQNPKKGIKTISDFINIGVGDEELLELVEEKSSLEYMEKYREKFDLDPSEEYKKKIGHIFEQSNPKTNYGILINKGQVNSGKKAFTKEILDIIDQKWKDTIESEFGYKSYEEMKLKINKELGNSFSDL